MSDTIFQLGPTFLHVCFDKHAENGREASGSITGTALENAYPFKNLQEFLIQVDQCLDKIGKPQASREKRHSFTEPPVQVASYQGDPVVYHSSEKIHDEVGEAGTLNILFRTRFYSTWQGAVFDRDGKWLGDFSSDLQLLEMMCNACKAKKE